MHFGCLHAITTSLWAALSIIENDKLCYIILNFFTKVLHRFEPVLLMVINSHRHSVTLLVLYLAALT
jgi:hypothetical protein